jgi:hypothetical protein
MNVSGKIFLAQENTCGLQDDKRFSASIARAEFPRAKGIVAISGFSSAQVTTNISSSGMKDLQVKDFKKCVYMSVP